MTSQTMDAVDEMDFSFSCDKCSFSTKDMTEIKLHMHGHRNSPVAEGESGVGNPSPKKTQDVASDAREDGDGGSDEKAEKPSASPANDTAAAAAGLTSIAGRIHSRQRRQTVVRTTPNEEEDDDDYIPYRPAKRVTVSRGKRAAGKHRKALHSLRAKARQQPAIANDRCKCKQCSFVCKYPQNLNAHMRGSHPEVYERSGTTAAADEDEDGDGDSAGADSESQAIADAPQCSVAADRYRCTLCDDFFCRFKKDLKEHKSHHHGIPTAVYKYQSRIREDRYSCQLCDFVCKFQRTLRFHRRSLHPRVLKPAEPKKKRVSETRYQCVACDFTCKFKGQMKEHQAKSHKKERPPPKVKEIECEFCHKVIQGSNHHYKRHLKTHTGDKPFKCDVCNAVFGDLSRLNAHSPIHLDERNYLCDQCGKSFKRAINLRMHRKVHLLVRPHGCKLCDYRCKRHDTLNLHMKRKHLKIRPVLCHTCGKKFFTEKECQLHAARRHLPRPTPFQCKFCPAAFPFAYNLRAHMKKHPEHKPFRCEYCTFESRSKASLQDHEKMHTGEKQKKCKHCDYTTSTSSNLYKHRKRQHGIVPSRPRASRLVDRDVQRPISLVIHGSASQQQQQQQQHQQHQQQQHQQQQQASTSQPAMLAETTLETTLHEAHQIHIQNRLAGAPSSSSGLRSSTSPAITHSVAAATMDTRTVLTYDGIDRHAVIYGREKAQISSVITEALAEARNVVQSEMYSGHMIPTSIQPPVFTHPIATTMAPPPGGMASAEAIIHSGIAATSSSVQPPPPGAPNMFNNMINILY